MTTACWIILGAMLAWTPGMIVLALMLRHAKEKNGEPNV